MLLIDNLVTVELLGLTIRLGFVCRSIGCARIVPVEISIVIGRFTDSIRIRFWREMVFSTFFGLGGFRIQWRGSCS